MRGLPSKTREEGSGTGRSYEAVNPGGIGVEAHDLTHVIDPSSIRLTCTWNVERHETESAFDESLVSRYAKVAAHHLTGIIDTKRVGECRTWMLD